MRYSIVSEFRRVIFLIYSFFRLSYRVSRIVPFNKKVILFSFEFKSRLVASKQKFTEQIKKNEKFYLAIYQTKQNRVPILYPVLSCDKHVMCESYPVLFLLKIKLQV